MRTVLLADKRYHAVYAGYGCKESIKKLVGRTLVKPLLSGE